jgi:SAM-dependent methyltransferase
MPTVEWNRQVWGERHTWAKDGDEWSGMADHCHQPYDLWKQGLVETFITPMPDGARALEIAPGYGRWTEYLRQRAGTLALVDLNQSCLDACQARFADHDNITYHLTEGSSLDFLADASIDFAWSFDSFVHMEPSIIQAYLHELARVLAPGGTAVIHHGNLVDATLRFMPITAKLGTPGRVLQRLASQHRWHDSGRRAPISARKVAQWAADVGLTVVSQVDRWGDRGQYTVAKFRDRITTLRK